MPILNKDDYRPSLMYKSGHLNTLYPALFRKTEEDLDQYRQRITTPDDDFLDIDYRKSGNDKLVILLHGLEGSSRSQYIVFLSKLLHLNGYDVLAMNFRSCSGEMNKALRIYHSGETTDLHFILEKYQSNYEEINLVGFSLGGNVILKYLGENNNILSNKIKKAVAVSTPVQLSNGADRILNIENKIYERSFLRALKNKVKKKHEMYPNAINIEDLKRVNNLVDFDEYFTSKIHGFKDAQDYYEKCSSKQFLSNIEQPTLIINALDDPFLPEACYPYKEAEASDFVYLLTPKYGGHVGYTTNDEEYYWSEMTILKFLNGTLIDEG